jgi:fatty acid desaturase
MENQPEKKYVPEEQNKKSKKAPVLAVILLAIGIVWLLIELGLITADVPWLPIVLIFVAIGMIYNRFKT